MTVSRGPATDLFSLRTCSERQVRRVWRNQQLVLLLAALETQAARPGTACGRPGVSGRGAWSAHRACPSLVQQPRGPTGFRAFDLVEP